MFKNREVVFLLAYLALLLYINTCTKQILTHYKYKQAGWMVRFQSVVFHVNLLPNLMTDSRWHNTDQHTYKSPHTSPHAQGTPTNSLVHDCMVNSDH